MVDKDNPKPSGVNIRKPDQYLLTGLLFTPDGTAWQADGKFYRVGRKGKRVLRAAVDELVLHQIAREIHGEAFVAQVVQGAHEMADSIDDDPHSLEQALRSVEGKIGRITAAIEDAPDSKALVAKLKALEAERDRLQEERAMVADRGKLKKALRAMTTKDVEAMLEFAPTSPEADVAYVRRSLGALAERVDFDADTRALRVHYRVQVPGTASKKVGGAQLASPRGTVLDAPLGKLDWEWRVAA
jgi:hypothetical protein